MSVPTDLLYTKEHEWIRVSGNKGRVGITHFAQSQLGDVVFVELPSVGTTVTQGKNFGVVESVKTVSDLYAPVNGKITGVNRELESAPELVNKEPYGGGWMVEIEFAAPEEVKNLLAPAQYTELTAH